MHGRHKFGERHSMGKQRNHTHKYNKVTKVNGRTMDICTQPQCKAKHYV